MPVLLQALAIAAGISLALLTLFLIVLTKDLLKDWLKVDPFEELRDQAEQFRRIALASELQTAAMRIRVDLLKEEP